jgi:hypothetical protein
MQCHVAWNEVMGYQLSEACSFPFWPDQAEHAVLFPPCAYQREYR